MSTVELDFFGMEKENSSKSQLKNLFNRQGSFRGVQNAISKISPELLKSMISSGSNQSSNVNLFPMKSFSVPSSPKGDQTCLPVYNPVIRPTSEISPETAPLTVFYNGVVSVFDVSRDKAENILKLAVDSGSNSKAGVESPEQARRRSLQVFLQKRKERLTSVSPYGCHKEPTSFQKKPKEEQFLA